MAGAVTAAANAAVPVIKARLVVNNLNLEAAYEGTWGNALRARIDHDVVGPDAANLFNLSVKDGGTGQIETIRNVSVVRHPPTARGQGTGAGVEACAYARRRCQAPDRVQASRPRRWVWSLQDRIPLPPRRRAVSPSSLRTVRR